MMERTAGMIGVIGIGAVHVRDGRETGGNAGSGQAKNEENRREFLHAFPDRRSFEMNLSSLARASLGLLPLRQ